MCGQSEIGSSFAGAIVSFLLRGYTIGAVHEFKAMEFAITVPACAGADDSWLPGGARSFLFRSGGGLELRCG
jgi:hypothetical protein